jgi:hypothetical protein
MTVKIKQMSNSILSKYIHYDVNSEEVSGITKDVSLTPVYETVTVDADIKSSVLQQAIEMPEKELPKEKKRLTNSNIIKNISFDQSEILWNIMQLYNDGKPFDCDMTASELKFYGPGRGQYEIPVPKILFDVYPQSENIQKIEKWGDLPLEDNSIHSIVIDLPFVVSPANSPSAVNPNKGSQLIARRFAAYYPVDNLYLSYYNWLRNAYRVLDEGGICVFKEQSVISGGIRHNTDEFSYMAAERVGFKMVDKFILEAKARLISNAKYKDGQKHSRSFTSQFLVFVKEKKRKSKEFNYAELLDRCEREYAEGFVNVVEK